MSRVAVLQLLFRLKPAGAVGTSAFLPQSACWSRRYTRASPGDGMQGPEVCCVYPVLASWRLRAGSARYWASRIFSRGSFEVHHSLRSLLATSRCPRIACCMHTAHTHSLTHTHTHTNTHTHTHTPTHTHTHARAHI